MYRSDDHLSPGFDNRHFYDHSKRDARTIISSSQLESSQIDNNNIIKASSTNTTPTTPHQQFHSSNHRRQIHNSDYHACSSIESSYSPGPLNDVVVVRGRPRVRHNTNNRNGSYAICVDR